MGEVSTRTIVLLIVIAVPLLLCQSAWIFRDARNRGEKHYWIWGLFGLLNVPQSLLIYLIVTRLIIDKYKKN